MLFVTFTIVLVSSFIRAVSGFGYALLATPLLTFVYDAKSVVVLNVILSTGANILVLWQTRRYIDYKRLVFISLGGLCGVPLGAYLLSWLDSLVIELVIAVLVIPFSILLLLGRSYQFKRDVIGCIVAGVVSGILVASTSLGGPPVVLFLINQGLVTQKFVATLAAYFLVIGLTSIGAFSSMGMVTTDLLGKVVILLPALFIGSYIGVKVLPKINASLFRKIVPALVSLSAIVIIISVIIEL